MDGIGEAVDAITAGNLIVYPTETVYGLGGDATDSDVIEQVFSLKERDRSNPLSVAVPNIPAVDDVARPSPFTRRFMELFLPGPVTVVCSRNPDLPPELPAGNDRIGIRIPRHQLARTLLQETPPLTATSANPSGTASPRSVDELAPQIREQVAIVLDGGEGDGIASTVVDPERGVIHRRGADIDRIEWWLSANEPNQADSP